MQRDFKQLTVHVEELNEESLSSQATKYYRTDILIQMHGAALGGWGTKAGLGSTGCCARLSGLVWQVP